MGPAKGTLEIERAAEAPIKPTIAGSLTPSKERTVTIICTSARKSLGNSGLIALSIALPDKIAFSDGLVSLFIKRCGVIRPPAYYFSAYSTERGK